MRKSKSTSRPSFRPKMNNGKFKKKTSNPTQAMYGEDWQTLSSYVRKRDNYRCMAHKVGLSKCSNSFPPPFHGLLHAHHIVPLPKGPNHPTNLISLCRDCHGKIHNKYLGSISSKQKNAAKRIRT